MRYLCIDYGQKRVGLAMSDPLGIIAQPMGFLPRDGQTLRKLVGMVKEHEVQEIVLGHPISMDGRPSAMTLEVEKFAKELQDALSVPVHLWDERLSTAQSERFLVGADVRRSKRKEVRDSIAASLILQSFLEAQSAS